MENCRHVANIGPSANPSILNPQKWCCSVCSTTESVWACLLCPNIACGRDINGHALQHYDDTGHPVSLEVNELFVYCYVCNDYVLNDNSNGDIEMLRDIVKAIAHTDHVQAPARTLLRSRSVLQASSSSSVQGPMLQYMVIKLRTTNIKFKYFGAWRMFVASQRRKRSSKTPPLKEGYRGVTGLTNIGNTCYLNSVLQVLSNTDAFREHLLRNISPAQQSLALPAATSEATKPQLSPNTPSPRRTYRRNPGGLNGGHSDEAQVAKPYYNNEENRSTLKDALGALLRTMWSGEQTTVVPYGFVQAMWNAIPSFRGYNQQDAQELLCEMLDKLSTELAADVSPSSKKGRKRKSSAVSPGLTKSSAIDPSSFIARLFQGELTSLVTCLQCGRKSETIEPFMDLSLEFPDSYHTSNRLALPGPQFYDNMCHLTELLAAFTATEHLGEVYRCDTCTKTGANSSSTKKSSHLSPAEKQILVKRLPQILRLHLKRFRWSGRNIREKIAGHVKFEEFLDMAPYCVSKLRDTPCKYRLSAVIIHHGRGFNKGHYTAYCWNEKENFWLHCNDTNLALCSMGDVLEAQAYILFYTKCSTENSPAKIEESGCAAKLPPRCGAGQILLPEIVLPKLSLDLPLSEDSSNNKRSKRERSSASSSETYGLRNRESPKKLENKSGKNS